MVAIFLFTQERLHMSLWPLTFSSQQNERALCPRRSSFLPITTVSFSLPQLVATSLLSLASLVVHLLYHQLISKTTLGFIGLTTWIPRIFPGEIRNWQVPHSV